MKERGTTGAGEPQITGVPRVHRDLKRTHGRGHNWERHSPWSNQGSPQRNSPVDTTSNDQRQYGDGRGEVIPSFDGADFRQYERRVRLLVSNTRVAPERRVGKLVEGLERRGFDSCGGIQDIETPNGVENLLGRLKHSNEEGLWTTASTITSVSEGRKSGITTRDSTFCRNPLIMAHVILRKANLSAQIVSAARVDTSTSH